MGELERKIKGQKIFYEKKISIEVNTDKRTHFKVIGDTEEHTVVFDKNKDTWSCSCKFSSLKNKECSHIIACQLSIKKHGVGKYIKE